jgi:hypothetical protein
MALIFVSFFSLLFIQGGGQDDAVGCWGSQGLRGAARVRGYGELLEARLRWAARGRGNGFPGMETSSTTRHRLAPRSVPRQRLAAASTSGSLTTAGSDLGLRQTSATRPRPAATAGGSSSLSTWPTAASFLDAWIWAWWACIQVRDFF